MTLSDAGSLSGADWAGFVQSTSREQMLGRWLAILCQQVGEVQNGLLLLASLEADTFTPAAVWPNAGQDLSRLGAAAQQALQERRGLVLAADGSADGTADSTAAGACIAYPVEIDGALKGAVVLLVRARAPAQLKQALRQVHWASAWLVDLFRQQTLQATDRRLSHVTLANTAMAAVLQETDSRRAAMALVTFLAQRLVCDRVSLGFETHGEIALAAVSNSATFDARADIHRHTVEAMNETLDLGLAVQHPGVGDENLLNAAHAQLARAAADGASGDASVAWSVPLMAQGRATGVLCFERHQGPRADADELQACRVIGELLGALLALRRSDERGLWRRGADRVREGAAALLGPHHPGAKLLGAVGLVLLAVLVFARVDYRVSAKTVVEGAALRATVAPFEGFVAESLVRAGDTVRQGQLLARLDDRDLALEQARWRSEREQMLRKLRQAQAQHDRAAASVLAAQVEQAAAQEALAGERLQRAQLVAAVDGVVVSGDLRQLIGSPVEQGKVLFEVAPLDAFRVVLQVDERDIGPLAVGQAGELVLAGLPGERLPFTVQRITPVAVAEDGRNFFRVEAQLASSAQHLRPGMEGVGKVEVGTRPMWWVALRPLIDWLRVALWTWLP